MHGPINIRFPPIVFYINEDEVRYLNRRFARRETHLRNVAYYLEHSILTSYNSNDYVHKRGHLAQDWLRHCATSRTVAYSIPSGHTTALGPNQTLKEISTMNIYEG